jgi:chromosome segregation ATPase
MKIIEIANGRNETRPADAKSVLEQRLADLEATVRRRQKDWRAARDAASDPPDNLAELVTRERAARIALERELAARQAQYERDIARADAVRAMIDEQIREAALEVGRARAAEASAAAAVERLTRAEADAVARLAEREDEFATELSTITATRDGLEQQLSDVEAALTAARQRHELAAVEVDRLTRREAELSALCANEGATRATLERRVAEVEAALAEVSEQISREQEAAAERHAAHQAQLEEEIGRRLSVEESLAAAETAHAAAELRHESAMAASAALLSERENELAAMLAEVAAIRDALERRVADAEAALNDAAQRHQSAMASADARLVEREATFATELASISETRDSLERQLRDVEVRYNDEAHARETLQQAITELRSAAAEAERRFREETAALAESARADRTRLEDQLSREQVDLRTQLANAQQDHRSTIAAAAMRLAQREGEFQTELAALDAARAGLEQQLGDVQARLTQEIAAREALAREIGELRTAAAMAERRFREEAATLAEISQTERALLEDRLSGERQELETQLANEQRARRSESDAAAMRLAEREAVFAAELAALTESRDTLERQLRDVDASLKAEIAARGTLERSIGELRSASAAAERRFREEVAALVENARAEREQLEDQLSRERHELETRLANEQQEHQSAQAAAASRLAERETQFQTELATFTATRVSLERQLRDVEARLVREAEARASLENAIASLRTAATAAERQFREEIGAVTDKAQADRVRLEGQLAHERQQHRSAIAAAATELKERKKTFQAELSAITEARGNLERQLRDVEATLGQERTAREELEQAISQLRSEANAAEQRFREESATLATTVSAERKRLQSELAAIVAARDGLEQQLHDLGARFALETAAREQLETQIGELTQAAAAAEQRFREDAASFAEKARAERAGLEEQLSSERLEHQTRLAREQQQHRWAMAAATTRLAERDEKFQIELTAITASRDGLEQQLKDIEARFTQETAARQALETQIAELAEAAAAAERRFSEETATLAESAGAERARLEEQLSSERREHQSQLANAQHEHKSAVAAAATQLAEREQTFHAELAAIAAARDQLAGQLRDVEARLTRETEARTALERAIRELQSAAADHERRLRGEIAALTEQGNTERAGFESQIARERALADDRLSARGAEFEAELERLSGDHASAMADVQALVAERDTRIEDQARAFASLQKRLDESESENWRQFDETPVPMVRWTRDGSLADANHAFAALVGCRTPNELRDKSVAAALFESRNDLVWLVERSVNAKKTESVETTCMRKDGTRVAVRLSARPSLSGLVEIAVEDLTGVRILEDRLREAHRMEAVGRVASEVAGTCEKLLRDVQQDAERLLTSLSDTHAQAHHADTLLDDVTRARSFLQQLVSYGRAQTAALAPVDVNTILVDLQPVLKQVAGEAVAIELRRSSSPVHVDMTAERAERLLVNVATFGRERMPNGGRLRIELSTVVVDGKFVSQYPDVRQGPHALITVTEVARPAVSEESDHAAERDSAAPARRPGVDLGTLQELISECGGHLWITAEPGGSMVVKMRLPLRAAWSGQADANSRHGLGRMGARLFGR